MQQRLSTRIAKQTGRQYRYQIHMRDRMRLCERQQAGEIAPVVDITHDLVGLQQTGQQAKHQSERVMPRQHTEHTASLKREGIRVTVQHRAQVAIRDCHPPGRPRSARGAQQQSHVARGRLSRCPQRRQRLLGPPGGPRRQHPDNIRRKFAQTHQQTRIQLIKHRSVALGDRHHR